MSVSQSFCPPFARVYPSTFTNWINRSQSCTVVHTIWATAKHRQTGACIHAHNTYGMYIYTYAYCVDRSAWTAYILHMNAATHNLYMLDTIYYRVRNVSCNLRTIMQMYGRSAPTLSSSSYDEGTMDRKEKASGTRWEREEKKGMTGAIWIRRALQMRRCTGGQ